MGNFSDRDKLTLVYISDLGQLQVKREKNNFFVLF